MPEETPLESAVEMLVVWTVFVDSAVDAVADIPVAAVSVP